MIHGLDTSFLVAVEVSSHKEHASARSRFQELLKAQDAFALVPQILAEFVGATGPGDTPSRRRILTCRPSARSTGSGPTVSKVEPSAPREEEPCARQILSGLARLAYRRPVTEADLAPVVAFYREGRRQGSFESGIQLVLRRILASPSFVYRVEEEPTDLRCSEHLRESFPPRDAGRRCTPGAARQGQRPVGDLPRRPHRAGAAGQVDSRESARHPAAAPERARPSAAGGREAAHHARAHGDPSSQPFLRELPPRHGLARVCDGEFQCGGGVADPYVKTPEGWRFKIRAHVRKREMGDPRS